MSQSARKARLDMAAHEAYGDPFAKALEGLAEWDRECREAHEKHMAEIAELRRAFDEAMAS